MGDCAKHLLWFRRLLYIITMQHVPTTPINTTPTTVFNDNNGAVFLSKEEAVNARSKHIDIRHHFLRNLVRQHIIFPAMIDTKDIPADMLTKASSTTALNRCWILIGIVGWEEATV